MRGSRLFSACFFPVSGRPHSGKAGDVEIALHTGASIDIAGGVDKYL